MSLQQEGQLCSWGSSLPQGSAVHTGQRCVPAASGPAPAQGGDGLQTWGEAQETLERLLVWIETMSMGGLRGAGGSKQQG